MRHLILGTSGHVDHGKTALVRALTGIECDTHKEEKRRGITINLGFAHLDLPSGDTISIVDVPGHRDFINTMVAGASGIDIAMLVVAADSGVMPQTREHLQIMQVLGIGSGLVAITRTDLCELEVALMAEEEVRELTKGTFLEGCRIVRVSSLTGDGIDELRRAIGDTAREVADRPEREVFRMYIDRIFSVSGFGTVVTGSVLGGTISTGSPAYLLPPGRELRVRRIERHGAETTSVRAGDRASLNLAGLSKEEFTRGMLIADRPLRSTTMLDVRLRLFEHSRPIHLWSKAVFLLGTFEAQVRVHLLDRDVAGGGEQALAQLHLPQPCVAQPGDRFVLRSTASDVSIGGGEVLDAAPLHHRRRPDALVRNLAKLAEGRLPELIAAEVRKRFRGTSHMSLADTLNVAPGEVLDASGNVAGDIATMVSGDQSFFIAKDDLERMTDAITENLVAYHRSHPLQEQGRAPDELLGALGMDRDDDGPEMLRAVLESMEKQGRVRRVGHTWSLASHKVEVAPAMSAHIAAVQQYLAACGMKTPLMSELEQLARKLGIDDRMLRQILKHLVASGSAYLVDGNYIDAAVADRCRTRLLDTLQHTPDGLTVAQFRDLVGGNRKICLLLYSLFDSEGITERRGDVRVITDKGRAQVSHSH